MKDLNRQTAPNHTYPERVIQFGEGNFLRAFVDWIIYNMNEKAGFNSSVVVVQPIGGNSMVLHFHQYLHFLYFWFHHYKPFL